MKGFIVYQNYIVENNKAYVCLFGRLENGESFLTINEFKPYFYIKKGDLEEAFSYGDFEYEETEMKTFDGKSATKVILKIPAEVPKLRKKLEENGINCYEADIRFPYRFMMDLGLQGSLDIDGDYESGQKVDRIYKNPELKPTDYFPNNLKVFSFDIESGKSEDGELYCIGIRCGDLKKTFINCKDKVENAISCKDEEELLEKFVNEITECDPDIITGWNVIDFDLTYLIKKCKKYKINFNIGRDNKNPRLTLGEGFFKESKIDVSGRQVLDALHLIKVSFLKVPDYKLYTVANFILGDRKLIQTQGKEKYKEIDELFLNNKKRLVEYNIKDADLVLQIIDKTKILDLTIKRSLLTGMALDRVNASIASLDSLYIREANKKNLVCPSGNYVVKEEGIKGGYVRESEPGIYDYILILDFKSLYPSIMRTFNIDPYSYVKDCKGKNLIKAPNGVCFRNEDGILPSILEKLFYESEEARKNKDELTRYAVKILMNSFFGVLGNPSCRFFDMGLVNAITYFGQFILKMTWEEIEKLKYKVIAGDTDSSFVVSKAKSLEEAEEIGKKIEKHINDFYKNYIRKEYNRTSYLELSYEKCFIKFLMPKVRKGEAGAKKRYAGLIIKDRKEEIQFTGLESVRGDWTDLAKKFQNELLDKIFHNQEVTEYVKKFVKDLKAGKLDELLVYKKNLRKELKDYAVKTPHKKAAEKILSSGNKIESNIIKYVMTEDGPEPIDYVKHKIDYKHYIE